MYSSEVSSSTTSRRRQRAGRRRFRYRKQAWCLLVSLLVLGFGANLLIMVRILMFTNPEQNDSKITTNSNKPASSNSGTSSTGGNNSNDTPYYYNVVAYLIGLIVAVAIIVRGINPRHLWKAIVLSPIAFVSESIRATLRWCQGRNPIHTTTRATATDLNSMARSPMTVVQTLEAFNRERLARGESTVSSESIEAYERFLRDLATFVVVGEDSTEIARISTNPRQGIPKAQLDTICPRWTIDPPATTDKEGKVQSKSRHFLSQTECGICLEGYSQCVPCDETTNEHQLRTLPCKHTFHAHCIDQWLGRSVTCPMCKGSVLAADNRSTSEHRAGNQGNENMYIL